MHLVEIAKIKVVPHGLIRFEDGELCYITKRIDRTETGAKIAMEDMCQLSERLIEHKYKGSYEQIAKLIIKYTDAPILNLTNFWEQVLFSWVTGNADMHLKNFSLDNKGQNYELTPDYDLLSTKLVIPEDTEELALTLNGKKKRFNKKDFKAAFISSGLNEKVVENTTNKFIKAESKWTEFIDVSFLPTEMKESYKALIRQQLLKLN